LLYHQLRGRQLRLVVLRDKDDVAFSPIANAARLNRALAGIELSDDGSSPAAPPKTRTAVPSLLDTLSQNAAQLGANWSPVPIVGDLPKVEEAT
jgi:hypothetical protein